MRHPIFIFCVAAAMVAAFAIAADALTLDGKSLDGQSYGATLYSSSGMEDARVIFLGDRARVYLPSGMFLTLRLQSEDIGDPNFISARGFDGQTYRIQLKGSVAGFGPTGDAGLGELRPHPGPH
jgi:hypothetical protein